LFFPLPLSTCVATRERHIHTHSKGGSVLPG
jgi:hypothetical protein